jgi:hypothetical protein
VAQARPSGFVLRVAEACRVVAALTDLFERVAGLLRQLVSVVGGLVLLWDAVGLLAHPSLSVAHLMAPGAGALAVIQGFIRPGRRQRGGPTVMPDEVARLESSGNANGLVADGAAGLASGGTPRPGAGGVPPGRARRSLKFRMWLQSLDGALGTCHVPVVLQQRSVISLGVAA